MKNPLTHWETEEKNYEYEKLGVKNFSNRKEKLGEESHELGKMTGKKRLNLKRDRREKPREETSNKYPLGVTN